MALGIINNISSLTAQVNLTKANDSLKTTFERLSSGMRINSAKDDAAGLAISERMKTQISGNEMAMRNANDGISLAQTAEGALGSVSGLLQRMRELALQSSSGSVSSENRSVLQLEAAQLQEELNRVAQTTEFNGQRILDGSFSNGSFQVGANAGDNINFAIGSVKGSSIGAIAQGTGAAVSTSAATNITIALGGGTATAIGSSANYAGTKNGQGATSAYAKAAALNDAGISGFKATASTTVTSTVAAIGGTAGDTYTLTINGTTIFNGTDVATALSNTALRDQINLNSDTTGVVAELNGGDLTLTAADGRDITVTEAGTGFVVNTDGLAADADITSGTAVKGTITLSAEKSIAIGGTQADIGFTSAGVALDALGVDSIDVSTQTGAQTALKRLDSALGTINNMRAKLGAVQNRFEKTIGNLQNTNTNLASANSRIVDTDFAAETAKLTKNQVLVQAGTAILAQANQAPQNVLSLLRG